MSLLFMRPLQVMTLDFQAGYVYANFLQKNVLMLSQPD